MPLEDHIITFHEPGCPGLIMSHRGRNGWTELVCNECQKMIGIVDTVWFEKAMEKVGPLRR
jgi:hypothetical protein